MKVCVWLTSILLVSPGVFTGQTPRTHDKPTITTGTVLVQMPVLVTTSSSKIVSGLSANDFVVNDNGMKQSVRVEPNAPRPVSMVVLLQTGSAARLVFPLYRNLETMLANMLGQAPNECAIVSFDSRVEGATPFTSDLGDWTDAINHPDDGDHGAAIYDALTYALDLFSQAPASNRRVILLISQPQDDGSKATAKQIVRKAGESNTAIYSVTFSPEKAAFKAQINGPPALNPPIVVNPAAGPTQNYFNLGEPLRLLLGGMRRNAPAQVSDLTGAESLRFDTDVQLGAALNVLTNHLRNEYILSFTPTDPRPGLHVLEVALKAHPELSVRARRAYWISGAQPDPSTRAVPTQRSKLP